VFGDKYVCAGCQPAWVQSLRQGMPGAYVEAGTRHYAGFWIRAVSQVIDTIILLVIQFSMGLVVGFLSSAVGAVPVPPPLLFAVQVASAVVGFAYYTFCWARFGATPGKMIIGLKVIDESGGPVRPGQAVKRWFSQILSGIILGIGFMKAGWSPEKEALHDGIAGTRVIYSR
jgi:uncharacterized RDD family membrane protein YckC